ncbi:T9SS type A sorting domain-containing protein [Microvirga sp. STS02]|uniref:T9SS type A sorting domain-containing protein n=1 Tax=Hymenobacter negativus TaxID=2795026 RepID=UPI0018DC9AC9|nr:MULTISPECIES: T9SS type A sorting domain-containing protein [Bacteria]MBH8567340.1 T9SS type A sorting domain-containing protein [Hymenobacter negativus]MBR7207072.1 T9SS type A sorting domain-containing protein [Microvirga sp. STS02]
MNKHFTLSALAALALSSLSAHAQFTVDGTLSAAEIGTGTGKYQLLGTYVGTHSVNDRGLKAIYMGTTATTLNIMVVASPEQTSYSALVLYLDAPNKTGVAAGTRLPGGDDASSQLRHRPTLDFQADFGFRVTASPLGGGDLSAYHSKMDLTLPLNTAGKAPDKYLGPADKQGTTFTISDATTNFVGAKVAFKTAAGGSVTANNSTGWEVEYPLSSLGGAATGSLFRVMAGYVADNGDFYSDVLPQVAGRTTDLGTDPNFTTIAGNQFYTYQVGTGLLANRAATAEALGLNAYPNPLTSASTLSYTVASGTQPVSVEVYNALGQRVLSLLNADQAAGTHTTALAPLQQLAAGSYLVKLQVGTQLTSRRVVVE